MILTAMAQLFDDFRYLEQVEAGDLAALQFETRIGDRQLHGADILRFADDDTIVELTVMVRPLSGVRALLDRMQQLVAR